MIEIDGSTGEGGGQILRTALGLSLVSTKPFHIKNIRARRKKPGLMRQHLAAVLAAARIGNAQIDGAAVGSTDLAFTPGKIQAGDFHFSIGTAGSCTLVFQTILPSLLAANGPSNIILEGGTHNPMAPPYDFLAATFLPVLEKMGVEVRAELERPGFFPAGGGRVSIWVNPSEKLAPLSLTSRSVKRLSARAVCARLPFHIARRELAVVRNKLKLEERDLEAVLLDNHGPGNVISVFVHADEIVETFTGFGRKHVRAEQVAMGVVRQVKDYLKIDARLACTSPTSC